MVKFLLPFLAQPSSTHSRGRKKSHKAERLSAHYRTRAHVSEYCTCVGTKKKSIHLVHAGTLFFVHVVLQPCLQGGSTSLNPSNSNYPLVRLCWIDSPCTSFGPILGTHLPDHRKLGIYLTMCCCFTKGLTDTCGQSRTGEDGRHMRGASTRHVRLTPASTSDRFGLKQWEWHWRPLWGGRKLPVVGGNHASSTGDLNLSPGTGFRQSTALHCTIAIRTTP
jgi:hypothetical protein